MKVDMSHALATTGRMIVKVDGAEVAALEADNVANYAIIYPKNPDGTWSDEQTPEGALATKRIEGKVEIFIDNILLDARGKKIRPTFDGRLPKGLQSALRDKVPNAPCHKCEAKAHKQRDCDECGGTGRERETKKAKAWIAENIQRWRQRNG